MSKYFDEELSECIAAKAEGRVISKEIAMLIAATWHTPANRLVSFSTAGIVMREMVGIANAEMKDVCSRPHHFDDDDSVGDLGTVPQNLVALYALREYFESVCAGLRYEEIDLEEFGDVILDQWSNGVTEVSWWVRSVPYGAVEKYPTYEDAEEAVINYIASEIADEAAQDREERELSASEYKHA